MARHTRKVTESQWIRTNLAKSVFVLKIGTRQAHVHVSLLSAVQYPEVVITDLEPAADSIAVIEYTYYYYSTDNLVVFALLSYENINWPHIPCNNKLTKDKTLLNVQSRALL